MRITCDNCDKLGFMKKHDVEKWKHHFCCNICYFEYRRKHLEEYKTKTLKNLASQNKIKMLAKLYKEKREGIL